MIIGGLRKTRDVALSVLVALYPFSAFCYTNEEYYLLFKIEGALDVYKLEFGEYPSSLVDLAALQQVPSLEKHVSHESYVDWTGLIVYKYPSEHSNCEYDLYHVGENSVDEFGEGDDVSLCGDGKFGFLIKLIVFVAGLACFVLFLKVRGLKQTAR